MKWFDFNGDGDISMDEEFLAFKIFEEVTKEDRQDRLFDDEESYGIDDPDDFEDMDDELDEDLDRSEWDDSFEGIDNPDDFEDW